jgi:hypothetical protein
LTIYAEEATQMDKDSGRSVWIEAESTDVKKELLSMFDRIGLEDLIFGMARGVCMYGDDFNQIIASGTRGVEALEYTNPNRLTRIEDRFGRLKGFAAGLHSEPELAKPGSEKKLKLSKPWDFIHLRLTSTHRQVKHGETVLMAARRVWRQLKIIEDTLVLYRLNRSTDKDVWYIDVGEQTPDQQWQTINQFRRELRKKFFVDPATGKMRQEYDPRTADEDWYVPVTKDSGTKVERLTGSPGSGEIYDVDHFRDKFFAAVRIPKAFMGYEQDVNAKATLVSQDIRFARSIKRVQRAIRHGLTHLCRIHLALRGYDVTEETNNFKVRMASINHLDDQAEAELYGMRYNVTAQMLQLSQGGEAEGPKGADGEAGEPVAIPPIITNVEAWTRFCLQKFMSFTDEEMEMFMGKPEPGKAGQTDTIKTAKMFSEVAEGLEDQMSEEAWTALQEAKDAVMEKLIGADGQDDVHVFDEVPAHEGKAYSKYLDRVLNEDGGRKEAPELKEDEDELWDLEAEEKALREVVGEGVDPQNIECPAVRCDGKLTHIFDEAEGRAYMRCSEGCGFIAEVEHGQEAILKTTR